MRKIIVATFTVCLGLWIFLAFGRTAINFGKLVFEETDLFFASNNNRIKSTYGELYEFCKFAYDNTRETSTIYFLTSDVHAFYFCRYEVYPRKMFLVREKEVLPENPDRNSYLLVLGAKGTNFSESLFDWKLIKKYQPGSIGGALYKK